MTMPLEGSLRTVLSHLQLPLRAQQARVDSGDLDRYTGRYLSLDEDDSPPEIEVSLAMDGLWADFHWPSSHRLVPEGGTRFSLEATTSQLVFDVGLEEHIRGLSILFGWRDDASHRYRKVDDGRRPR